MQNQKKIGILTFSYSSNCGSILQAYALQKKIFSIDGCEADIIHYSKTSYGKPVWGRDVFTRNIKDWKPKNIVNWTTQILAHPLKMKKAEAFFKKYYHGFLKRPFTREELPSLDEKYDAFVVGSDQVWNCGSPQVDDTYFLDFVKDSSKKISYAASFGRTDVQEDQKENARRLISQFSSISVREPNGVDIVYDLTEKKATWVLDPSLLLQKEDYRKIEAPVKKKGYVLLYLRHASKEMEEFAAKLAQAKGLKVIKIMKHWVCKGGRRTLKTVGPREWLGYIDGADYVVTNSFHGLCFSIVYEKEFFADFLPEAVANTNSRMIGLLQQFELSHRQMNKDADFDALETIDYSLVNIIKKRRQEESLNYLKNAIKGNEFE